MPKAASDKQKEKEKQPEEIMAPLDQRLDTIIKMIMDAKEDNKKEHERGQEKFGKDIKSLRDDMKVRDEKLAQAEGELVHLGNKTRDLENDYLSLDRRIQEQEAAIVSQAATIESQNLKIPLQSSPPPLPYPSLPPLPCLQSLSCPPHPPSTTITVSSSLYDIPSAWTREGHSLLRTRGMG